MSVRYALPLSFSSFLLDILYALFSICILAPGNEKWDHRGDILCGVGSGMLQSGGGCCEYLVSEWDYLTMSYTQDEHPRVSVF